MKKIISKFLDRTRKMSNLVFMTVLVIIFLLPSIILLVIPSLYISKHIENPIIAFGGLAYYCVLLIMAMKVLYSLRPKNWEDGSKRSGRADPESQSFSSLSEKIIFAYLRRELSPSEHERVEKIISESILTYPVFEKILGAYKSYLRRYGDRAEEVMEADHKEFDEFTDQYFTEMKQKDPELN
ncbi:hypothetical protein A2914_00900 [Candidatus Nomurabacteria bacterium RIFCSPLOWO2_01_FULL_41_21]|uniref:Uncharacterized protein n=2 Tax=Candidatus Nomuraibacteriota TaxID=1752729 RepID=A0A1F6V2E4_9BACT|nr:MAG: hypothetical protein A2733_01990 [Candidatus Nomurabacteria bacterium RIFCSPHIGHO2_01_FULL_40_20]OGI87874.1 MAG: hypothetical protein A2914_00900 [Candidatus Nomurabacteria bacterium RIFCSPLOWO2_01_FULL_41_21]